MKTEKALFASGCFWGVQYHFDKHDGVIRTTVGYTGGTVEHPTYEQVSTGTTGHREAIEMEFNPSVTTYENLVKLFFETHNFSQIGGQGPDIGEQYTSAIYYYTLEQKEVAERLIMKLEEDGHSVTTVVLPAQTFYAAEEYHQEYYNKKGGVPYCHVYIQRF
ncbi:peptide-methionine (S)-S-oxide reductase [Candidatus Kaiserbacteria bacterium]|nr:MAG: peptide-methionine (S)-S-oxide reductase [Candidatus Kaiserbacteria bacterium]